MNRTKRPISQRLQKKMAKTTEGRTYEEALAWLRDNGFDTTDAPGTNNRVFLR